MSNYLAIATVTAALGQLIREAINAEMAGAQVNIARPQDTTFTDPTVNLYLYQITANAAWRNTDLPTRNDRGDLKQRPQAALDLHYLLTFYGNEAQLEPERLLAIVARTLHAQPQLTRQRIRDTIINPSYPFLADSDLADQIELVKFSPTPLSLEELSKLWSVFLQTPYVLSAVYQGSVVLIESEVVPQTPLPVRERNVYVLPFRQPLIEQLSGQTAGGEPIDTIDAQTATLLIQGRQLRGDVTTVRIAGTEVTPANVSDTRIELSLSALPAGTLHAGLQPVQVVHQLSLGTPAAPHPGTESNVAAFALHPLIVDFIPITTPATSIEPRSVTLTIQSNPVIGKTQRVVLLLNEASDDNPAAFSFVAPSRDTDTDTLDFIIGDVNAGDYLLRLQVDGVANALIVDDDPDSPSYQQYIAPKVTIL